MSYDTWLTSHPDDFYEPGMSDPLFIEEVEKQAEAKEILEALIQQLYIEGDVTSFENSLEDLADIFELKIPDGEPLLTKTSPDYFSYGVGLAREIQKNLKPQGEKE